MKARFFLKVTLLLTFSLGGAAAAFAQEVTEVTLEMVPGNYGVIREFKIVFRRDGRATFHGKKSVSLIGKYHAAITREQFDSLAKLVTDKNFFSLNGVFPTSSTFAMGPGVPIITSPEVITTVSLSNNKQRTIRRPYTADVKVNAPNQPPRELLEIEAAITKLSTGVRWVKDKD